MRRIYKLLEDGIIYLDSDFKSIKLCNDACKNIFDLDGKEYKSELLSCLDKYGIKNLKEKYNI